tara:strand:- start:2025 stop:3536 length:1512 start_codon:yes stop_codon:yes gene_type:complete
MNINDRELLARTLQAEAGNQGYDGMLAAGSVIMNRANATGYGDGMRGVILKPGQFSAWNSSTGYAGGEQGQDMANMRASGEAYKAADALISGTYDDATGGATHYYNPAISQPKWGQKAGDEWKRIGDHVFGFADAGKKPNPNQAIASDTMKALGSLPDAVGLLGASQASNNTESKMIPEEKPRGLLGSLGIQKMEEGAEGEAGQRFFQRDTFKDTAAQLAQGFAAMGSSPALQKMTADVASQRTESKAKNKTIEYLRANGRGDLADAVESNAIDIRDAATEMFKKPVDTKGVAVGNNLVNPVTGEVIYQGEQKPAYEAKDVSAARKEFAGIPAVKSFGQQTSAYGRVLASAKDPSAAGDLALIFNFMKVLDPGSTVREGEFATAQNAGGVDQRVVSLYNSITTGERLSPAQRDDFANRATRLYSDAELQYDNISRQYSTFAEQAGLPVDQVIPDFSYSGNRYESPLAFRRPAAPNGILAEDWVRSWENMTDEQRREFVDGGAG